MTKWFSAGLRLTAAWLRPLRLLRPLCPSFSRNVAAVQILLHQTSFILKDRTAASCGQLLKEEGSSWWGDNELGGGGVLCVLQRLR